MLISVVLFSLCFFVSRSFVQSCCRRFQAVGSKSSVSSNLATVSRFTLRRICNVVIKRKVNIVWKRWVLASQALRMRQKERLRDILQRVFRSGQRGSCLDVAKNSGFVAQSTRCASSSTTTSRLHCKRGFSILI